MSPNAKRIARRRSTLGLATILALALATVPAWGRGGGGGGGGGHGGGFGGGGFGGGGHFGGDSFAGRSYGGGRGPGAFGHDGGYPHLEHDGRVAPYVYSPYYGYGPYYYGWSGPYCDPASRYYDPLYC